MASQILLNPIGSSGDVFPFLALGRELQKRGHHVAVMTNPIFKQNIGHAGLECIEIGTEAELRSVGRDPRLHRTGQAWKLALKWGAVGTMRQTLGVIETRISKCDTLVIAPPIAFGSRIAAEKFRIPLATVVLSPFLIRSVFQSPVMPPMILNDRVPKISKRLQYWLADRLAIDPILGPDVNRFRQELGLARQSRFLHRWCFSEDLTLALFPEFFANGQPDWPSNLHLTGLVSWDPPMNHRVDQSLDNFLDPDDKPILLLAGSAGPESVEFYRAWIEATKSLGRQLVLLERNQTMVPANLPGHVYHAPYYPIDRILCRSAVVAHSGGVGTTLRAFAAGVPQIVVPRVNDQPDNAQRIKDLGVGCVVAPKQLSVGQILSHLKRTINSQQILDNCAKYQRQFGENDPILESCDRIEETFDRYRN